MFDGNEVEDPATKITQAIKRFALEDEGESQLDRHDHVLKELASVLMEKHWNLGEASEHFALGLKSLETDEKWLVRAQNSFAAGCMVTAVIIEQQLLRAREMGLAAMFRMEYDIASQCAYHHDFTEGVRALLIDKDNVPRWQFSEGSEIPSSHILRHFESTKPHPLDDLGH